MLRMEAATITTLHEQLIQRMLDSPDTRATSGTSVGSPSLIVATAESAQWACQLDELWLSRSKWSTLAAQYVDPQQMDHWLNLVETRLVKTRMNVATLHMRGVDSQLDRSVVTRRFANCLNHVSFRRRPFPELTLSSRTTYLGYLSGLDLTLAHRLAEAAAEACGVDVEDVRFTWLLEMAQYNSEKAMGYALTRGIETVPSTPARKCHTMTVRYLEGLDEKGVSYDEMKMASRRRLRQRWHAYTKPAEEATEFGTALGRFAPLHSDDLRF